MKNLKWINFGLVLIVLVVFLIGIGSPNIPQDAVYEIVDGTNTNVMQLRDTAETEVEPNEVKVNLRIVTRDEDHQSAVDENTEINNEIINYFEDDYEVVSESYRVSEWTDRDPETREINVLGYEVYNTISIKSEDIEKAGEITSKAFDLGAHEVQSIDYRIDDEKRREIQDELTNEAIKAIKERAENIAQVSGVDITGIVEISPDSWDYSPVTMRSEEVQMEMADASTYQEPDFSPGEEKVSTSVSITFRIK